MAQRVHARLTSREGRKFGFTLGAAFLALGWWRASTILQILGILLILAGLVLPTRLGPVQRAWMGGAHAISRITTPVALAVIYFGVIAPAGLVMRLVGRRPLKQRADARTFWVTRERTRAPDQMEHQF